MVVYSVGISSPFLCLVFFSVVQTKQLIQKKLCFEANRLVLNAVLFPLIVKQNSWACYLINPVFFEDSVSDHSGFS